ncbi:MAG: DUF4249 domain-containing protein [Bacteroidota bacterium]|nr:hypothetical protein [Odoribacter sp.]MDP3642662.1 DUF4249 domain-containing protein [Bacteroidota bacterium]
MSRVSFFIYLFCLFLVFSCEKDLNTAIDVFKKPCFNCILNPDSVITATVSMSKSITNEGMPDKILDAVIELKEEGKPSLFLKHIGNGKYKTDHKPSVGTKYSVEISIPNYLTLKATTIVPIRPEVKYIKGYLKPKEEIKSRYSSLPFYPYTFEINDKPGLNRYWVYSMEKYIGNNYKWDFRSMYYGPDFIQYDDFNKETDAGFLNGFYFLYYLRILDSGIGSNVFQVNEECPVDQNYRYFFMDTDEHYDKYLKSTIKQAMNDGDNLLFNEPVQIYSNIENGLGIFGSAAITSFKL